jgi:hypothetical protein
MKNLKNFSLLCISLILTSGCCITPPNCSTDGGNLTFGPEVSYRLSKFTGSDAKDDDYKRLGSVGIGVYAHWIFCEDYPEMGFLSGLHYNQFGAKYEYTSDDKGKLRVGYLTIPFTFTYKVFEGVNVEIGPDLSFLLSAKDTYEYMGQKETYDLKDDTNKVQIGYSIAGSYMHEESGLGGFIRWNGGFSNVNKEGDYVIHNGGFSIGARYRINHLFKK